MKARDRITLQTILVAIIIIVAVVYGVFIKPNYYNFNGGKIFFEPIYSESFVARDEYEIHSYDQALYFSSQNGLKKLTTNRESLWDKVFYLENPKLFVENEYMAVVDLGGKEAYIFDDKGYLMSVKVESPIILADISEEGALALVIEKEGKHLIQLYKRNGKLYAERGTNFSTDGYPVAIDLSSSGEKMVTSYLSVKDGIMKSTIAFFSFGDTGEIDPDNILGGFNVDNAIAPEIKFFDDDHLIVISDKSLFFYYIKDKPKLAKDIKFKNEIKKIAYTKENVVVYFGKQVEATKNDLNNKIAIYSYEGEVLDEYDAPDNVISLIGGDSNYYIITPSTIELHSIKKKLWEAQIDKGAKNILSIGKGKFVIVYQQGYEIVKMKDI
ncbi:MAG: hypothetical protein CVU84_16800 [Firmicutes bacterium HGW-Firmicutes-1]|nr:MAG: hypothetical protein CVU84_16800 [Firmicutes bacterium HGW-Firmicutes-1]